MRPTWVYGIADVQRTVNPWSLVQPQVDPPYPNRGCKFDYLGKLELTEVSEHRFSYNISGLIYGGLAER